MSSVHRLTERHTFTGGKVDRAAGTISDCVICGLTSENDRDYPWAGPLRGQHTKYEGAPSNCDHGRDDAIDRRLGWFTDVAPGADGKPRGTFHLLLSHPMAERVLEAAEKNPRLFGFSHVIDAKTTRRAGREIVESIERVISIDLVATPATTKSFFEGKTVPTTLRAVIETHRAKLSEALQKSVRKVLLLAEEDGAMGAMMDAPVEAPPEGAEGEDAMDDAFKQLMHTSLDKLLDESHTIAEFISNIRAIYKTRAQVTGAGSTADADADTSAADDAPKGESKRLKAADVLAECAAVKFSPTYEQGEHLRAIPDKGTRAVVIESFKRATEATGETPRSSGRPPVREERTPDPKAAPTMEEIKKRIRA